MARAATTSDAFNAVAEPRRREILNYLALEERSVGEIVDAMELEQPSVSKHLRVLKDVGLVRVREWYAGVEGDIIVAAHGGVARALAVLFGVRTPKDALDGNVDQGVVYEFGPGVMNRYE